MNIILDLDGTLIYTDIDNDPCARNHLEEFLTYCFKCFEYVSIWTAAGSDWVEVCQKYIFSSILKRISKKLNKPIQFFQMWSGNKCIKTYDYREDVFYGKSERIKPLKKWWKAHKHLNIKKHNTIIVDDTKKTFQKNYGNAILIPTIDEPSCYRDNFLSLLIHYFEHFLFKEYETYGTFRRIEKRNWIEVTTNWVVNDKLKQQ